MEHNFDRAPTVTMLRKLIREAEGRNQTAISFQFKEQFSEFTKANGKWYHHGNGHLKAGYKLADMLDAEYQAERDAPGRLSF